MTGDNLVLMANQIGQFFSAMPDREEALDGIAEHIRRYWAPPMRRSLLLRLDDRIGLSELVLESLRAHRAELMPAG